MSEQNEKRDPKDIEYTVKELKRTLMTSVLSLLLCIAMLAGTSFAWFSDSVSTSDNENKSEIVSGSVDVELEVYSESEGHYVKVADNGIFPGLTGLEPGFPVTAYLKLYNLGSLPVDFYLSVTLPNEVCYTNRKGESVCLSNLMKFTLREFSEPYGEDASGGYISREAELKACTVGVENGFNFEPLLSGKLAGKTDDSEAHCKYFALTMLIPEDMADTVNYGDNKPAFDISVRVFSRQEADTQDTPAPDDTAVAALVSNDLIFLKPYVPETPAPDKNTKAQKKAPAKKVQPPEFYLNAQDEADETLYIISEKGLRDLGALSSEETAGKTFCLANDISFTGEVTGAVIPQFNAVFYGGGHTISGLRFATDDPAVSCGLFGRLTGGAVVKDLVLKNCVLEQSSTDVFPESNFVETPSCGVLASVIDSTEGKVLVENVRVVGGSVSSRQNAGGLVGMAYGKNTEIRSCVTTGVSVSGYYYCGGLVGAVYDKLLMVECSYEANSFTCTAPEAAVSDGYCLIVKDEPYVPTEEPEPGESETPEDAEPVEGEDIEPVEPEEAPAVEPEYYLCFGNYYIDNYSVTDEHYHGTAHNDYIR